MDGFLGEIRMFAGNYAPEGWALCDGRMLSIANYSALFSLLGTTYGGDGVNNFAVPDLRGRLPLGQGQGATLTPRVLGQSFGEENHLLSVAELPAHTHKVFAGGAATSETPTGRVPGTSAFKLYTPLTATPEQMAANALTSAGGGQAHANMMPTLCINFIIALSGTYPQQN